MSVQTYTQLDSTAQNDPSSITKHTMMTSYSLQRLS